MVATSNPGKLHVLQGRAGDRGTFTSKVRDSDTVSSWGRLRWEAQAPDGRTIELQTRSGNTGTPDTTWSDWSPPYTQPEGVPITASARASSSSRRRSTGRDGGTPVLDSVSAAYLQRNLRPQVQSITVHPPGEVFQKPLSLTGEAEILGLERRRAPSRGPGAAPRTPQLPATSYSRKLYQKGIQTFSWRTDDANGDTLSYDVSYRRVNDTRFRRCARGSRTPCWPGTRRRCPTAAT